MDFRLDDDQLALQDGIRQFCAARYPLDRLAERPTGPLDRAAWNELAGLGVFSLLLPEADGGLGLGAVGTSIVFEQLGYHLVPGPLVWSTLAAPLVEGAGDGRVVVGGAMPQGAGPVFVEHAEAVDSVVVLRSSGVHQIDRSALGSVVDHDSLDPLNPVASFADLPTGTLIADAARSADLALVGTVLTASLQLGVAQAALDVAVAYSLEREQFGVPIGSFQALKHLMADMYVRTNLARSATYAAAAVLDDPAVGDGPRSTSGAKLLAGEAAIDNARGAVQVLGGMGFTWDMPPNFLLKRAWVLDHTFGTSSSPAMALAWSVAEEVA